MNDRAALIALYDAANGANWKDSTQWSTDKPLSEWHGITTNALGQVTELLLYNNDLSGHIPAELGQLENLEALWLYNNGLSGAIPSELGQLTNLKWLALDNNRLSGPIPAALGQLTNLEGLWLEYNDLSGQIPAELGQLENLKELWLGGNPDLYAPEDEEFQKWLGNLKEFSIDSPYLKEIERLLNAIKPPDDQVRILAFLKLYLGVTQTLKKEIGSMGNGVTTVQGFAIQKALDDLAEIEETIAQVEKQTKDMVQQQSELQVQNVQLEAELEAKNSALKDKITDLAAQNATLKDEEAALERRRGTIEEVARSLAERETEILQIEASIKKIDAGSDAFCVDEMVEKFHEMVEKLRQKDQDGRDIMGQIGGVLRLHRDDNVEVLEALKQCGELEPANLSNAIDLSDRVAKKLNNIDHCLGTLTEERE